MGKSQGGEEFQSHLKQSGVQKSPGNYEACWSASTATVAERSAAARAGKSGWTTSRPVLKYLGYSAHLQWSQ